ncbi:hypothetical protein BHE74_00024943 [Ensete ventricosum]|nr:hypothetical protein BHE74_00024943 [Ensete ventricosum]
MGVRPDAWEHHEGSLRPEDSCIRCNQSTSSSSPFSLVELRVWSSFTCPTNMLLVHAQCELRAFFDVHDREGSHPRGIHLEMTGKKVTECVSGSQAITLDDLGSRYRTHCE